FDCSFADGEESPLADAFEVVHAAVLERDLGAGDQILDRAGDKDLAALRLRCDARADRNGDAGGLRSHQLALARVQADPDLELERAYIVRQRPRALDRSSRTVERGEETRRLQCPPQRRRTLPTVDE